MTNKDSSFGHYVDRIDSITSDIKEREHSMSKQNVSFVKELSMSDSEYFKKIFSDAEKIDVHITWGFDEQQADPFHKCIRSDEFVRRLKRFVLEKGIRQ